MEIIAIVIPTILSIIIAFTPYLRKKYFVRPELTIEIINGSRSSTPLGYIKQNYPALDGNTYIDANKAIRGYELIWEFKIKITNNSESTAFYPNLSFNPNKPKLQLTKKINELEPIKSSETLIIKGEYKIYEEKTGDNRTDISGKLPKEINEIDILLSYENQHKTRFYTKFSFSDKKNVFVRKLPIQYKKTLTI